MDHLAAAKAYLRAAKEFPKDPRAAQACVNSELAAQKAGDHATLDQSGGGIVFRFHARDLHLVMGPAPDGKPIRFQVTINGAPPGDSHGTDVDPRGQGVVTGKRLYQLVRQEGEVSDRTFEIRFLDPGIQAYSFTFG